ncbi:TPA: PH domain-containing protein [Bacillus pseudomycoides]|nr:PH domain-containing protein [Bacillus pseudomycoides]
MGTISFLSRDYKHTSHCCIWFHQNYDPLHEITSIRYTYNSLSAPAWTFKRVEITYSNYDIALISLPKDPDLFMKTMQEKCPLLNKNKI